MRRAFELAARGKGRVSPNPLVGAVVVRDGRIVGEGWHAEVGSPHAEVVALEAAGEAARGATLYVTLEPCRHHGRTPPCTEAIVAAGVGRVVYAASDPHPRAAGGAETLRGAGIEVVHAEADVSGVAVEQNAAFLWSATVSRPFVVLKLAQSIDGMIAAAPGERTDLTGGPARELVQELRAEADAVLVGRGTVSADDPRLTARGALRPRVPPLRVVLDTAAKLSTDSALVTTMDEAPVLVFVAGSAPRSRLAELRAAGVEICVVPRAGAGLLDPAAVLDELHERGVRSVLVEGGARIAASFLEAGLVERFHQFVAPKVIGTGGVPAFAELSPAVGAAWTLARSERVGDDAHLVWERKSAFERLRVGA
jgi:diaminohydroxyphosphoribosylaminopyrimidine deaminase/5-amino-6-(5-phosphoribosylamino)uracil reductase